MNSLYPVCPVAFFLQVTKYVMFRVILSTSSLCALPIQVFLSGFIPKGGREGEEGSDRARIRVV